MITKVKDQIQTLINTANAATGNTDTDLTTAVGALVDGYGGVDYLRYVTSVAFKDLNLFGKSEVEITLGNIRTLAGSFSADILNTTVEKITVNVESDITAVSSVFYALKADSTLKHIVFNVDVSNISIVSSMFYLLYALEKIEGTPFDFSSATTAVNTFGQCRSLKEVRFKANTIGVPLNFAQSSLLSAESIQSIIDGLVDLTGIDAQTITFHADVKEKLTDSQIASITAKNWNLA